MTTYIDIEVFDLGSAYSLYATQLSLLANFMTRGRDLADREKGLKKEADRLRDSIKRCRLEVEIKDHFVSVEEIKELISTYRVQRDIANEIVTKHSRKQELLFKLALTIRLIFVAQTTGMDTEKLCTDVHDLGGQLKIPEKLIKTACSKPKEGYSVVREHFQQLFSQATDSSKEKAPDNLQQALARIVWGSKWRVFFIILVTLLIALYMVWATLPDNTKEKLIDSILERKTSN